MIWIATLSDGTVLREYENGDLTEFEDIKDRLVSLKLTETGNDLSLPFNGDSGVVKFNTLNPSRVIPEGTEIKFVFDSKTQSFRMDKDSLQFYNDYVLRDVRVYDSIELDSEGVFLINGNKFEVGLEISGVPINMKSGTNQEFCHYKLGATDLVIRYIEGHSQPVRKRDHVMSYAIGYKNTYMHGTLELTVHCLLVYNLIDRVIKMDLLVTASEKVNSKIFLTYGDKRSFIPVCLYENQPVQTDRILCMI